jgi:hypothetical protein
MEDEHGLKEVILFENVEILSEMPEIAPLVEHPLAASWL